MNRFRSILVAYGDEVGGDDALGQAVNLARENGSHLTVACLLRKNQQTKPIMEEAEKRLRRMAASLLDSGVYDIETTLLTGHPATELAGLVSRGNHDLLVSSAEIGKNIMGVFLGGMGAQLIKYCPCPVWVIKPGQNTPTKQILAAVEASEEPARLDFDREILEVAVSLALQDWARLHIASAWKLNGDDLDTVRSGIAPQHREKILERCKCAHEAAVHKLLAQVRLSGIECRVHLTQEPPDVAISKLARHESIDLVVMGAMGKRNLSGLWSRAFAVTVMETVESGLIAVKPNPDMVGLSLAQPAIGGLPENRAVQERAPRVA